MSSIESGDLRTVFKRYISYVNGVPVVVEGVPYLYDPETDEYFLEPTTSEALFNLIRSPNKKNDLTSAYIYRWAGAESDLPALALRFIGKGYEYGRTPVSLFARAADRVREMSSSIRQEVQKRTESSSKKLNPFTSEPRVSGVVPGSLVFTLEAPDEGLFPDETEQAIVQETMEIVVDTAIWISNIENSTLPARLVDPQIRAVALRTVERLLPAGKENDAALELSGSLVNNADIKIKKIELNADMKPIVREKFTEAVAEFQQGEVATLIGRVETLGKKGKVKIGGLNWETKSLDGKYDPGDLEIVRQLSQFWADETLVEVQGVVSRKPDGTARRIDIHYISMAPKENN